MNLKKGDLAVVHRPRSPMAKSAPNEEEKGGSFSQLEFSYLVGDSPDL